MQHLAAKKRKNEVDTNTTMFSDYSRGNNKNAGAGAGAPVLVVSE